MASTNEFRNSWQRRGTLVNVYAIAAVWMALALVASLISIRAGIAVALAEILVGVLAGNLPGVSGMVQETAFTTFLASVGSITLTFLAGAEIDPVSLRRHWKASLAIGFVSFMLPFAAAFAVAYFALDWNLHAAEIAGVALSTTSVAVVYAVMVETGLNRKDLGKLILAACFVTDLGTVLALGALFAGFSLLLVAFAAATATRSRLNPAKSAPRASTVPRSVTKQAARMSLPSSCRLRPVSTITA